jgi:hypothetical protein
VLDRPPLPSAINTEKLANAYDVVTRAIGYKTVLLIHTSLQLPLARRSQLQQLTIRAMTTIIRMILSLMCTTDTRVIVVLNTIRVMIVILMGTIQRILWDLIIGRGNWQKSSNFDIFVRLRISFLFRGGVMLQFYALARAALFPIRLSWVRLASLKLFMHASSLILLLPPLALNSRIRNPSTYAL